MPTAATTANDKHDDWIRQERPFLTHGAHPSPPEATTHRCSRGANKIPKALAASNGTRGLANFKPKDEAAVLKPLFVLRCQGVILMGKTNLHELSFGWTNNNAIFCPVRNPHDPSRIPGGNSGARLLQLLQSGLALRT